MSPRRFAFAAEPDQIDPPKPGDPPWRSRRAHRSCDPEASAALRRGRLARGWNISEAARRSGVSRRMIGSLEAGTRRPSESTAGDLIRAYGLTARDAAAVWDIALPLVGRDSPYRGGWRPGDPDPRAW